MYQGRCRDVDLAMHEHYLLLPLNYYRSQFSAVALPYVLP